MRKPMPHSELQAVVKLQTTFSLVPTQLKLNLQRSLPQGPKKQNLHDMTRWTLRGEDLIKFTRAEPGYRLQSIIIP